MLRARCLILMTSLCLLAGPIKPSAAAVLVHNGTRVSMPPGTGDVDVTLTNNNFGNFIDDILEMDLLKEFGAITTHEAQVSFFAFEIPAFETVINLSNDPWGEFRIDLESMNPIQFLGADVVPANPAPLIDPVGALGPIEFTALGLSEVTVLSSVIEQTSDTLASLLINFGSAVDPGDAFTLRFGIHHDTIPEEPSFLMRETPVFGESIGGPNDIIPEPPSILIFIGFALCAALSAIRRKTRKTP